MSRKACTLFVALSLWQGLAVTACADARNFLTVGCDAWCQSVQWRESDYATIEAQLAAAQNPHRQVTASGEGGVTPLHWVAAFGEARSVKLLLGYGADPAKTDQRGNTALHFLAICGGGEDLQARVQALLQAGSRLEEKNQEGWTALHYAAGFNKEVALVDILLEAGAVLDAIDDRGRTPLHLAAQHHNIAIYEKLLAAGADASIKDDRERQAADVLARTKMLAEAPFWQKLLAIWQEMGEN